MYPLRVMAVSARSQKYLPLTNHNSSEKVFNFKIFYVFSDVIIGFPSDDDSIEIDENDHKEFFSILPLCFENVDTMLTIIVKVEGHMNR